MSVALSLLLTAALVVGNGLFVAVEFALLAARQTRLAELAGSSRRAHVALGATRQLPLMISGCQFGVTVCSLGLGAAGEPALARLVEPAFHAAGFPTAALQPVALGLSLLIVSGLHMVAGEMIPKNLALADPERAAVVLAPLLVLVVRLFRVVIVALTGAATLVLRLLRVTPASDADTVYTSAQIAGLVGEARDEGLLDSDAHDLLTGALVFHERTAAAVVLPLRDLTTIAAAVTPTAVEELVAATGFTRFPVRTASAPPADPLVGYLHLTDILNVPPSRRHRPVDPTLIRPLPPVPLTAPLHEVLNQLRRTGAHLAAAQDPAGRTVGVVALEDVLEELVGEVRDATRTP